MRIRKTKNPEYGYKNKEELYIETEKHREDVFRLMSFIAIELIETGHKHDWTKVKYFDQFAKDTLERQDEPDFKSRDWYKLHTKEERHHLNNKIPEDIDLIDIMEFLCDCICAGIARSGRVEKKFLELPADVLKKAYWNTIDKMKGEIKLEEEY